MVKRVLIVDDSRVSRMMIKARMQALHPDWEFLEAGSGDEALTLLDTSVPDFLTMDMNMPGLNGFDAAEQVATKAPSVCMVMLTANIQESSHVRAQAMGLKFVRKPITDASIKEVLDHFLAAA
ncbi:response regulator [Hydrogenophaga soli]